MSEKIAHGPTPLHDRFASIEGVVYSNNAQHFYGVDIENGKKIPLSREAALGELSDYSHKLALIDKHDNQVETFIAGNEAIKKAETDPEYTPNREEFMAVAKAAKLKYAPTQDDISYFQARSVRKDQQPYNRNRIINEPETIKPAEPKIDNPQKRLQDELITGKQLVEKVGGNLDIYWKLPEISAKLQELKSLIFDKEPNPTKAQETLNRANKQLFGQSIEEKEADIPKAEIPAKIELSPEPIITPEIKKAEEDSPEVQKEKLVAQLKAIIDKTVSVKGNLQERLKDKDTQALVRKIVKLVDNEKLSIDERKENLDEIVNTVYGIEDVKNAEETPETIRLNELKDQFVADLVKIRATSPKRKILKNERAFRNSPAGIAMKKEINTIISNQVFSEIKKSPRLISREEAIEMIRSKTEEETWPEIDARVSEDTEKARTSRARKFGRALMGRKSNGGPKTTNPIEVRSLEPFNHPIEFDEEGKLKDFRKSIKEKTDQKTVRPYEATWKNKDTDQPVRVTGDAGKGPDGREYVNIEGTTSSIPKDEVLVTDNLKAEKSVYNATIEVDKNGKFKEPKINGRPLGTAQPEVETNVETDNKESKESIFEVGENVKVWRKEGYWEEWIVNGKLIGSDGKERVFVSPSDSRSYPTVIPAEVLKGWQVDAETEKKNLVTI